MSRIGRLPVVIPQNVNVEIKGTNVRIKGPNGEMHHTFPSSMDISFKDGQIEVKRPSDERTQRALHGMTRALDQ